MAAVVLVPMFAAAGYSCFICFAVAAFLARGIFVIAKMLGR